MMRRLNLKHQRMRVLTNMNLNKKNILAISAIILVLLYLLFMSFNNKTNKNSMKTTASRSNITENSSSFLKNVPILPQYELDRLNKEIRRVVKLNNVSRNLGKYQIVVRDNSLKQTYNNKEFVYTTEFIVDLPSLEQSYRVHDEYYMIPHRYSNDYALLVTCPRSGDLIYPSFKCIDRIKRERGEI